MSMSDRDPKILETCHAIYGAGIPINWDDYDSPGLVNGYLLPEHPQFVDSCVFLLEETQKSIDRAGDPAIHTWSPFLIQTAADFARRHHLQLELLGGMHPDRNNPLGVLPGRIMMGLTAGLYAMTPERFQFLLEHEVAHLRDHAIVTTTYPEAARAINGQVPTLAELPSELRKTNRAYLKLFEAKISEKEKEFFRALQKKVFGDLENLPRERLAEIRVILAEVLRYGEEVYDPRFESYILPTTTPFTKNRMAQRKPDWSDFLIVASVQEAGLWKKFTKAEGFKPEFMKAFDPADIRFFRMMLRAASRYFYSCLR